jgi:transmembrane sensor
LEKFESIAKLYQKYLDNTCTVEELDQLLNEFGSDANEPVMRQLIAESWDVRSSESDLHALQIANRVESMLFPKISRQPLMTLAKTFSLWPRLAGAAAIALVVGIYVYDFEGDTGLVKDSLAAKDIAPGKVGATLTLASGKRVNLAYTADGEIAREAGISISKTKKGQIVYNLESKESDPVNSNTLSTANGQTYMVVLPDKSKVWLNSASSLTYTATLLASGVRRVELSGEAYFEISKDKAHPFIVDSKDQQVEVLGTHFNVNAYSNEPAVSTTLLEGSVKVSSGKTQQVLKPGFQAIADADHIKISKVNIETITDWKDGDFNLEGLEFKSAMRKIARWYDVEVVYDHAVSDNIISGGWISRDTKLSTILEVIQRSGLAHFRLEGRKLYVSR